MLILITLLALAFILVAITKYDIHPFLALFLGAIAFGLMAGMPTTKILESIEQGFGGVMGKIGILILLGVTIGTFLEKTGGAMVIAQKVLSWIGQQSITLAMMLSGYILSIPIFGDSTFIMMNPICKSLSFKGNVSYAGAAIALALGATASHSLVPPTPGPIAAAGIIEANLGSVILWGLLVSSISLIPAYFFVKRFVMDIPLEPKFAENEAVETVGQQPSAIKAFLPIVFPLFLIILASLASYPTKPFGEGVFAQIILFIGSPVMALLIGAFLSFLLPAKFDRKLLSSTGWIGDSLVLAAPVILITGAGGVFGKMLQNSGIDALIKNNLGDMNWGIFLPYLIAFFLKTAQGSSTVAMVTTASFIAPLLGTLGLDSETMRIFTVLAIGSGAVAISHANDSFFWAVTQLTGLTIKQGNLSHSLGTLIMSVTCILVIYSLTFVVG
jgi:GntP family gluconate:H+ symporter